MIRVAINGFGRIGRNVLRALLEREGEELIQIVAINDLGDADMNAHLLKYDSVHGTLNGDISVEGTMLTIQGYSLTQSIHLTNERKLQTLPWKELSIDIVLECTGVFTDAAHAKDHIDAGAQKVIISAPGKNVDKTVVYGINHWELKPEHQIISNASCTTNCLAFICRIIHDHFGIESGLMTTVHAYTNDQGLTDCMHTDKYRARSATQSLIPTKTGAASTIGQVIPELKGRLNGLAVRAPVINVSLVDVCFNLQQDSSVEAINICIEQAASQASLQKILSINQLPLVGIDFKHNPASCIIDLNQTMKIGRQIKIMAWYDNEWGFSNRMLDTATYLGQYCQ